METVIASTRNANKIKEMAAILKPFGMHVISRDEAGVPPFDVEEDGASFEENSYKKACAIMKATGRTTIADDSGLCVDALGGAPGLLSARLSGKHGDDAANRRRLLELMEKVPEGARGARFVSVITLMFPDGSYITARGECCGRITREERGTGGFGYDPLFVPEGSERSFAELPSEEKNRISHRARALAKLEEQLRKRDGLSREDCGACRAYEDHQDRQA